MRGSTKKTAISMFQNLENSVYGDTCFRILRRQRVCEWFIGPPRTRFSQMISSQAPLWGGDAQVFGRVGCRVGKSWLARRVVCVVRMLFGEVHAVAVAVTVCLFVSSVSAASSVPPSPSQYSQTTTAPPFPCFPLVASRSPFR